MESREISQAVIRRLPRYYRYLGELLESGVERISSNDLSKRMKVTASQIRQDLNNFGGFGQQGYGYNVKYLYTEIARILGIDRFICVRLSVCVCMCASLCVVYMHLPMCMLEGAREVYWCSAPITFCLITEPGTGLVSSKPQ